MLYSNSKAISSFLSATSCWDFWESICACIFISSALPAFSDWFFWTSVCAADWAAFVLDSVWAWIFSNCNCLSFSCFLTLRSFKSWLANLMFLISLTSIASSRSILFCCIAICMLFSKSCFSSSSGIKSIKIPKSYKCRFCISSNVATLWTPIACIKASFVGEYSIISDILRDKHSQVSAVKNKPACNICLVATLEFAAASFWTPTKAFLSGILPSLASLRPVTSLIICK